MNALATFLLVCDRQDCFTLLILTNPVILSGFSFLGVLASWRFIV